jgi:hypothetical protein
MEVDPRAGGLPGTSGEARPRIGHVRGYLATGPEAIQAFRHPFASARAARTCQQKRALQRRAAA